MCRVVTPFLRYIVNKSKLPGSDKQLVGTGGTPVQTMKGLQPLLGVRQPSTVPWGVSPAENGGLGTSC